jgi:hypothetical protein
VRLTVKIPVLGVAASAAFASVAATVTVGKATSSSAIVTVAVLGEPAVYEALELKVTVTVSLPSTTVSCIGVTVIVAEADPAGITTLPDNAV